MPRLTEAKLENAINRAVTELENYEVMSEEYIAILDRIGKLSKMKEAEKPSRQLSPDTVVLAATNLLGIFMIIRHEHLHVISSKAMNFAIKPK